MQLQGFASRQEETAAIRAGPAVNSWILTAARPVDRDSPGAGIKDDPGLFLSARRAPYHDAEASGAELSVLGWLEYGTSAESMDRRVPLRSDCRAAQRGTAFV